MSRGKQLGNLKGRRVSHLAETLAKSRWQEEMPDKWLEEREWLKASTSYQAALKDCNTPSRFFALLHHPQCNLEFTDEIWDLLAYGFSQALTPYLKKREPDMSVVWLETLSTKDYENLAKQVLLAKENHRSLKQPAEGRIEFGYHLIDQWLKITDPKKRKEEFLRFRLKSEQIHEIDLMIAQAGATPNPNGMSSVQAQMKVKEVARAIWDIPAYYLMAHWDLLVDQ